MSKGLLIKPNIFEFSGDFGDERMNAFTNFLSQISKSKNSQKICKKGSSLGSIQLFHVPIQIPCKSFEQQNLLSMHQIQKVYLAQKRLIMFHNWGS
jgi:hypothetical protein